MGLRMEPEPTIAGLEGCLIRGAGAHNLMGPQRPNPALHSPELWEISPSRFNLRYRDVNTCYVRISYFLRRLLLFNVRQR